MWNVCEKCVDHNDFALTAIGTGKSLLPTVTNYEKDSTVENTEQPTPPKLIDNPFAPEFFADEATGFFVHQGNVSITFSAARVDHRANPHLFPVSSSPVWFCPLPP
jgi:hypothetical protein